jgi:hypothetical protein
MPVTIPVRNLSKTNVILSMPSSKGESIEWGYAGIPSGTDIQEVPEDLWASTRMRSAKNRGILCEDTAEALQAALDRLRQTLADRKNLKESEVAALVSTPNGGEIIISEDQMEAHIEAMSRNQPSELLDDVTETASQQQSTGTSRPTVDVNNL